MSSEKNRSLLLVEVKIVYSEVKESDYREQEDELDEEQN